MKTKSGSESCQWNSATGRMMVDIKKMPNKKTSPVLSLSIIGPDSPLSATNEWLFCCKALTAEGFSKDGKNNFVKTILLKMNN